MFNRHTSILFFTSFTLITPKCDPKSGKIHPTRVRAGVTLLTNVFLLFVIVFSLYKRHQLIYKIFKNKMLIFLDITSDLSGYIWFLMASIQSWTKRSHWNVFLIQLGELDQAQQGHLHLELILFHVTYIIIASICFASWIIGATSQYIPTYYYISRMVLLYLEALITLTCIKLTQHFKQQYKGLLGRLLENDPIKEIQKHFIRIAEALDSYNELFGGHMFYIYFVVGIHYLTYFARVAHFILGNIYEVELGAIVLVKTLICITVALVELIALTYSCHTTEKLSGELLKTCYSRQAPSKEQQEGLARLLQVMAHRRTRFSAADVFDVNKSAMFALLSGVTSYFLVVLQSQQTF
ncbi:uncharacterized protein LOC126747634 [Anthonomus grandis grandis]|uniref:uncharacterized protein LOC126747634 n=1 Tax=Anthonomus grandis grandis TaxID=2921223 RepID=UPI002166B1E1|nr:uncharacterized protein LOC126747634 [Anthonomus grandis grandis]